MDLIRIAKAQLAYGTHPLLDDADAVIESGERVCIVGRNGAGKSTLLKVLDGQVTLDDGEINQLGGIRISRLEQDPPKGAAGSVFDYVAQGMPDIANFQFEVSAAIRAPRSALACASTALHPFSRSMPASKYCVGAHRRILRSPTQL